MGGLSEERSRLVAETKENATVAQQRFQGIKNSDGYVVNDFIFHIFQQIHLLQRSRHTLRHELYLKRPVRTA